MTARRRRKPGSGPSATALIAWVGGAKPGRPASASVSSSQASLAILAPYSSAPFAGRARARSLAAGTLLACGSVLAVGVHAADSSPPREKPAPASGLATTPDAGSGGSAAQTPLAAAARPVAAPAAGGLWTLGGPEVRAGKVHRNAPLFVGGSADPSFPSAELSQPVPLGLPVPERAGPLGPVERTGAPVAEVQRTVSAVMHGLAIPLTRETPVGPVVQQAVPVGSEAAALLAPVTEPAMSMLAPLPLG
jgi:hypothetical protein